MDISGQITFLPSSDLARSAAFYSDVLGLDLVLDQGPCLIWRTTGDSYVGVCEREHAIESTGVILTLVTEHVDEWCERIKDAGGTIASGPDHNDRFGIYQAFVHDPDGNVIEIQRFDDPEWSSPS